MRRPTILRLVSSICLALLCAPLVMPASAAGDAASAVDGGGSAAARSAPPQRIVSLAPALTEAICELGACDRVVGTDRFSNWPASVALLPKLGGLEDTPLERLIVLAPDLVVGAPATRALDRLAGLGLPVLTVHSHDLASTHRMLHVIEGALGTSGAADRVWARVEQRLEAAARAVPPALLGARVYFEVAPGFYAAGDASFVGELLRRLGLSNAIPASLGPFPQVGSEYVIRAQPHIIMASRADLQGMPSRPGWAALPALRNRRTCDFPPAVYDILVRPGPRLGEAAEHIAACLVRIHGQPR